MVMNDFKAEVHNNDNNTVHVPAALQQLELQLVQLGSWGHRLLRKYKGGQPRVVFFRALRL